MEAHERRSPDAMSCGSEAREPSSSRIVVGKLAATRVSAQYARSQSERRRRPASAPGRAVGAYGACSLMADRSFFRPSV